jgi:hypothetical protein
MVGQGNCFPLDLNPTTQYILVLLVSESPGPGKEVVVFLRNGENEG